MRWPRFPIEFVRNIFCLAPDVLTSSYVLLSIRSFERNTSSTKAVNDRGIEQRFPRSVSGQKQRAVVTLRTFNISAQSPNDEEMDANLDWDLILITLDTQVCIIRRRALLSSHEATQNSRPMRLQPFYTSIFVLCSACCFRMLKSDWRILHLIHLPEGFPEQFADRVAISLRIQARRTDWKRALRSIRKLHVQCFANKFSQPILTIFFLPISSRVSCLSNERRLSKSPIEKNGLGGIVYTF